MKKVIIGILLTGLIIIALFFTWYNKNLNELRNIKKFNSEFEGFIDREVTGVDLTTVVNKAIENNNKYDISISKNLIRVKYDHHFYYIDIIEEKGEFCWKLKPYKNSYYTTLVSDNSFERVLFAITEARNQKGNKL